MATVLTLLQQKPVTIMANSKLPKFLTTEEVLLAEEGSGDWEQDFMKWESTLLAKGRLEALLLE